MSSIFPISSPVDATKYRATDDRKIHWIKNIGDGLFEVHAEGGYRVFHADGTSPVLDWRVELRPGESVPDPLAELAKRVEALERTARTFDNIWEGLDQRLKELEPPHQGVADWLSELRDRASTHLKIMTGFDERLKALEQQASAPSPQPAPAPTRPLQVGDRVRNAAGTDTGVVGEIDHDGTVVIWWEHDRANMINYNPITWLHWEKPAHPGYGHVVLLESDFDTQAREAGYVKAEEVAERLFLLRMNSDDFVSAQRAYEDELRAQAKGGAK